MEIDLQIPLGLESVSRTDVVESESVVHCEEEDVSLEPGSRGHVVDDREVDEVGDVVGSGEGGSVNYEPQIGMEFESKETAYSFYREYARSVGFRITVRASRRSKKSGKFIDVKVVCSRFGNKRDSSAVANSRSCQKTDCKAGIHMKKRQDGMWYIYGFVKEHNHEIWADDIYYAIKGRGKKSEHISCQKKGLQLALHEEDVQLLLENFMNLQAENPSFFYALDFDQEKRMRNVFWVDVKGINDYKNFCDVVLLDTHYIKYKYNIPFAPIVGVNHHCQFILLGCALIGDETTSSYAWLMRTWLKAMGGEAPKVIITDEDKPIKEATVEVFPDARHCFCLWHVLEKISENVGPTLDTSVSFVSKLKKCIHRSQTNDGFEKRWWKMVDKFELREDEWFQSLYEDRQKWVPNYMIDTSLAGLSTVERCESVSSFFDKYIQKETTFKDFILQYKVWLHDIYVEEAKANFETQKQPIIRTLSPYEKQMSMVYTHAIFKKFQAEILGIDACSLRKECQGERTAIFLVDDFEGRQNFIVNWNEAESNIFCSCHSFEYKGFLCRHALIVLQISGVSSIPSHYILKRWRKVTNMKQITYGNCKKIQYRVQRFNDLCKLATKLGEAGSLSQESYNIAFYALQEAFKHCVGANNSATSVSDSNMLANQGFQSIEQENGEKKLVKASKRKKVQKKRKKVQAETELLSIGRQVNNLRMKLLNEGENSFDISSAPQQGLQGMDLSSRMSHFDGFYSSQHSTQGKLNPTSSMQDGYFTDQQGMNGMGQSNPTRVDQLTPQQRLQALLQGQLGFRAPTM